MVKPKKSFYSRRIWSRDNLPTTHIACITDDGKDYLYAVSRSERSAFKSWAIDKFIGSMKCKRLIGSWPNFTISQP